MGSTNLKHELAHFDGGGDTFFLPMVRDVRYTEGVRYFAQNAGKGAYWLLDILTTEPKIRAQGMNDFALIKLVVTDKKAVLTVDDGNSGSEPVFKKTISYTDCPEGEWKFYFEGGLIMLPCER